MNSNTKIEIHDNYDYEKRLLGVKQDLQCVQSKQCDMEKKLDRIINFLDNHESLMLQKINDFLTENRRLFVNILNDVLDKENSSKLVVDKINEFLTENRHIYTDLFESVYAQGKKNTKQIQAIKPLLDNINRTQECISSLIKLSNSTEINPIPNDMFDDPHY